ncbi:hypothetical protein NEF87_000490 [Candidatus Lokiarchaeum ossiferum]|uniref:Uncharacterized protein n=1 Tax=Candidatus Lokiarchaeum ossiferum TaxID=2951803 RepID=A0ABY6HL15_9ARCH|nr:hypothetical protein NEF87_000490 [Candidatus Lokiarchaeum sp. B-35]
MEQDLISEIKPTILNKTTKLITQVVGIFLAFSSFEHGLFESLQGNKKTEGFIIQSISQDMRFWEGGSEEAFTIIPNYLVTGILVMILSLTIIIWLLFFLNNIYGTKILGLLFLLITLVGGGIGYIPIVISLLIHSSKINKPIKEQNIKINSKIWPFTIGFATITWIILIEIAIWGYFPGVTGHDDLMNIVWICLLSTFIFVNISFLSGYSKDRENNLEYTKSNSNN